MEVTDDLKDYYKEKFVKIASKKKSLLQNIYDSSFIAQFV